MLSAAERKQLKAWAHKLEPVVLIGAKGVSDTLCQRTGTHAVQRIGKVFVIYRKRDET